MEEPAQHARPRRFGRYNVDLLCVDPSASSRRRSFSPLFMLRLLLTASHWFPGLSTHRNVDISPSCAKRAFAEPGHRPVTNRDVPQPLITATSGRENTVDQLVNGYAKINVTSAPITTLGVAIPESSLPLWYRTSKLATYPCAGTCDRDHTDHHPRKTVGFRRPEKTASTTAYHTDGKKMGAAFAAAGGCGHGGCGGSDGLHQDPAPRPPGLGPSHHNQEREAGAVSLTCYSAAEPGLNRLSLMLAKNFYSFHGVTSR